MTDITTATNIELAERENAINKLDDTLKDYATVLFKQGFPLTQLDEDVSDLISNITNDDKEMELILFLSESGNIDISITVEANTYRVKTIDGAGAITSSFEYDNFGSAVTRAGILMSEYGLFYTIER